MKRLSVFFAICILFAVSSFAGSTYYSKLNTYVASGSSGRGTVYSDPSGTQSSSTEGATKTFAAHATAAAGYDFCGWSETDGGAVVSYDNPWNVAVACSSDSSSSPTTKSVYANFGPAADYQWMTALTGGTRINSPTVTATSADDSKSVYVAYLNIDLSRFAGRRLRATIRAKGTNVLPGPASHNGFKFMLQWVDADSNSTYPQASSAEGAGTYDWKPISFTVDFTGKEPVSGVFRLGLELTTGTVEFDLTSFTIEELAPLFDKDESDNPCIYTSRVTDDPVKRGINLPTRGCTELDMVNIKKYGATLARFQIWRNNDTADQDVADYVAWVDSRVTHLVDDVLPLAAKYGIKIVVDLHIPPGGRVNGGVCRMYNNAAYAQAFVDVWTNIATRCQRNAMIWGFDLINEPLQTSDALENCDYLSVQRRAAAAIRQIDPDTPIIVESNNYCSSAKYDEMQVFDFTNVIYQVHVYEPFSYSHQGVRTSTKTYPIDSAYPDDALGYNRAAMTNNLAKVRAFQLRHGARIFAGEFAASPWAEGSDRYLTDAISVFEEYGWDWAYFSYEPANGIIDVSSHVWSLDYVSTVCAEPGSNQYYEFNPVNPRKTAVLMGLLHKSAAEVEAICRDDSDHVKESCVGETVVRNGKYRVNDALHDIFIGEGGEYVVNGQLMVCGTNNCLTVSNGTLRLNAQFAFYYSYEDPATELTESFGNNIVIQGSKPRIVASSGEGTDDLSDMSVYNTACLIFDLPVKQSEIYTEPVFQCGRSLSIAPRIMAFKNIAELRADLVREVDIPLARSKMNGSPSFGFTSSSAVRNRISEGNIALGLPDGCSIRTVDSAEGRTAYLHLTPTGARTPPAASAAVKLRLHPAK